MTTRRRIICSILSALCVASCSLIHPGTPQRLVRVKLLADASFRMRNPRWAGEARGLLEAASDYYEREFNIRLVSQSVSPWPEQERIRSTPALLARLQKEFPAQTKRDGYDVIVAFTAEGVSRYLTEGRPRVDRLGNCSQGLGSYAIVPIDKVFHYGGPTADLDFDVIALIHELAHIFGAAHVDDINSLMNENFGYRTDIDAKNRAVIRQNKFCPFAK